MKKGTDFEKLTEEAKRLAELPNETKIYKYKSENESKIKTMKVPKN